MLLAQSEVPIVAEPRHAAGREALLVQSPELARAGFTRFRLRPGDDASCLNLYRPDQPDDHRARSRRSSTSGRFTFAASLAETERGAGESVAAAAAHVRRWRGSGGRRRDLAAVRAARVASATRWRSTSARAAPLTLRFVGALRDSVLQGELVIGEEQFVRLFPDSGGFRFFLIDSDQVTTAEQAAALAGIVEKELQPFGVDAVSTTERLEAFHRVENTYLSTFQALGGLGLLLGTIGLAAVMFRNVLERRRELALLRAVGYDGRHVRLMILAETIFLLLAGLVAGVVCALIAVVPAWLAHGGGGPGAAWCFWSRRLPSPG